VENATQGTNSILSSLKLDEHSTIYHLSTIYGNKNINIKVPGLFEAFSDNRCQFVFSTFASHALIAFLAPTASFVFVTYSSLV